MSKNGWTPERRKRQAELIKQWKPWNNSTGATSEAGKAISSQNATKHGAYSEEAKALTRALKAQLQSLDEIQELIEK